jgi:acetylornithine/succinyldiaminopimelate/putrescine aminotransferase
VLATAVPGPRSRQQVDILALRECPAITARRARRAAALGVADTDPVVWAEAQGANVRDVDGNVYVDLCAGFGVAALGHRHPEVVAAGQAQLARLPHAMGDAFPDPTRVALLDRLCGLLGFDRGLLGSSGSDAVEAALKTAWLATGRRRVLAFEGGYHGLAAASLAAIGYHRDAFRGPFAGMLGSHVDLAPYGGAWPQLDAYAAVLVEPVQGRGGMRAPPEGWLPALHEAARAAGCLVVHDEIYSGLGRTGALLAGDHEGARPDLVCLGKALGGGFPISACLGTAAAMDAWGASTGEAIHTQTFLGNPVGCAMALASLGILQRDGLAGVAAASAASFRRSLERTRGVRGLTGRGMMIGVEVEDPLRATRALLERGWIVLPCGERADRLGLSPMLALPAPLQEGFCAALAEVA